MSPDERVTGLSPAGRPATWPGWARQVAVFAGFLALTFLLRRTTFLFSVLDWDESLYLLVSRGVLQGHLPYTVVYDNKPPGIYFLFALGQLAFGHSVMAIRILTCIAVAATCTGLEALGRMLVPRRAGTGFIAGFLYTVYAVRIAPASNTELFFAPFSVAAVVIIFEAIRSGRSFGVRRALSVGLLAGVAAQIKPFALIELAGVGCWAAWTLWTRRQSTGGTLLARARVPVAALVAGLLLPGLLVAGVFALLGHLPDYWDANVRANRVLAQLIRPDLAELVTNTWHRALRSWPIWGGALWGLADWVPTRGEPRRGPVTLAPVVVWFASAMLAVCVVGGRFPHYYLEPLVPLSLIAAAGGAAAAAWTSRRAPALGLVLLLVAAGAITWHENAPLQRTYRATMHDRATSGVPETGDPPALAARYIRGKAAPGDRVYVVDYQPVIYYLLDLPAPTRYAFPPFLADTTLNRVANVDAPRELRRILASAPRFLVLGRPLSNAAFYRVLDPLVDRYYQVDTESPSFLIFRLREGAADSLRMALSAGARER